MSNKCKIIDAGQMAETYDTNAKLDKLRSNKMLHELIHNDPSTQLDAKAPMKISKAALTKLAKGAKKPKKVKHVDLERFTTKGEQPYTYTEYSKALTTIIPNAANRLTFNNARFGSKLNKSKDLQHGITQLFAVDIENDLIGVGATVAALVLEEMIEARLGFDNKTANEKVKEYEKNVKQEVKNEAIPTLSESIGDPSKSST